MHNTYCSKSFTYLIESSQQTHASYFFYRHENGSLEKISYPRLIRETHPEPLICCLALGHHSTGPPWLGCLSPSDWAGQEETPGPALHSNLFYWCSHLLGDYTSIFVTCSTNTLYFVPCKILNSKLGLPASKGNRKPSTFPYSGRSRRSADLENHLVITRQPRCPQCIVGQGQHSVLSPWKQSEFEVLESKTSSIQITLKDGKGKKSANVAQCRGSPAQTQRSEWHQATTHKGSWSNKEGLSPSFSLYSLVSPTPTLALTFCLSLQKGYAIQESTGKNLHPQ